MSKTITSPVKKWPGSVTLADPLSYPQVFAIEDAIDEVKRLTSNGSQPSQMRLNGAWVPAMLACVEEWHLEGLGNPLVTFPATPGRSAALLLNWLIGEVTALFQEAEEIPNA